MHSNNEINQAIARACGWQYHDLKYAHVGGGAVFEQFWTRPGVDITKLTADQIAWDEGNLGVPNFCDSLDAMHEAEKALTPEQQMEYTYQVSQIVAPITGEDWCLMHTTALQRATAFVKTLNLETK